MSGMTAVLVEWYPACLDRAKQKALATTPGPWVAEVDDYQVFDGYRVRASGSEARPVAQAGCRCEGGAIAKHADAAHIADHDPSWRLADLDLKREIFAEHEPEQVGPGRLRCSVCADPPQYDATWHEWPCRTVRLLAREFDTEPGYRSEWAP